MYECKNSATNMFLLSSHQIKIKSKHDFDHKLFLIIVGIIIIILVLSHFTKTQHKIIH